MGKSNVKKGFFYYLFIFVGFAFGVVCILASILIFNPGQDIYGIGVRFVNYGQAQNFVSTNEEDSTIRKKFLDTTFNTVKFTSGYTNFNVVYDYNEYQPVIRFKPSITALSRSEDIDLDIKIRIDNDVLSIDVDEPELWIGFSNQISVYLVIPRDKNFTNVDFDINTKSGAVQFGDSTTKNYEINSLKITTESGIISLEKNLTIKTNTVNITSKDSRIRINTDIKNDLYINNEGGKVAIGKMSGNLHITNTNTLELNADVIGGDVYANSNNGFINIKQIGTTYINRGTVKNIKVLGYHEINNGNKEVTDPDYETLLYYSNGSFIAENNLDNTNVIIGKMTGFAIIEAQTGFVSIEKLGARADISTTTGSIEIKNAYNNIDAETTTGTITVTQHSDLARTLLTSEYASITANFTGFGSAELTTKGNIDVNVVTGLAFKFVYNAKDIQVSWITTTLPLNGFVLVSGADANSSAIVTANSENGKVTLTDGFKI